MLQVKVEGKTKSARWFLQESEHLRNN